MSFSNTGDYHHIISRVVVRFRRSYSFDIFLPIRAPLRDSEGRGRSSCTTLGAYCRRSWEHSEYRESALMLPDECNRL